MLTSTINIFPVYKTPIEALKVWQKEHLELFRKKVTDHAGPDT